VRKIIIEYIINDAEEGYEDICAELIFEDFNKNNTIPFEYQILSDTNPPIGED